jgi:hypothetical protein
MAKKKAKTKKTKEMGKIYHKKTEIDGIVFDSQTEAEYYEYLKDQFNKKRIRKFEMQKEFILQKKFLIINGERIDEDHKDFKKLQKANPGCTTQAIKYIADFVVYHSDGRVQVIDVKGQKTADFKLKEKMFNYMYPQYNKLFCVVKYKGEWLEYNEANKIKKANKKNKKYFDRRVLTMANKKKFEPTEKEIRDWNEVEDLVITYQTYVNSDDAEEKNLCKDPAEKLLNRFAPLFKKYIMLIKHNQIDFNDMEQKSFVSLFMDDITLRRVLNRKVTPASYRSEIYIKSNFIKETYGSNSEQDITNDLYICFLKIARRYKQVGKNFCAYLYNVFKHEVARMIKSNIKNPLSIPYKNFQYEDYVNGSEDNYQIEIYEDTYYESNTGLPDLSWVLGDTCGFEFVYLSPLQRKILVRYYLEDWSDRQIAESMGVQTSMINLRRRQALQILCEEFDVDINTLKRTRKSGTVRDKSK